MTPDRGCLVWLDFNPRKGHEQSGRRPAVVISPREYNEVSSCFLVCPVTSNTSPWPWKVPFAAGSIEGAVLVDQIKSIDPVARHLELAEAALSLEEVEEVLGRLKTLTE